MRRTVVTVLLFPLLIAAGVSTGMVGGARLQAAFGPRMPSGALLHAPPQARTDAAPVSYLRTPGDRDRESPELRALREADAALFPDLVPAAPPGSPSPAGSLDKAIALDEPSAGATFGAVPPPKARHFGLAPSGNDLWAGLRMPALPVTPHARTERYLRYFGESPEGRKLFARVLRRSGRFRDVILTSLRERALPAELLAVAFVESAFVPEAESPAGAMGLWQFMPHTGRAYGLHVDRQVDERRNPWLATSAAVRHLSDLHQRFGTWEEAIAAYNLGYKGLVDRMEQTGTSNFWALCDVPDVLPTETALYVPKVMAVATILANLDRFGFDDTALLPPVAAVEVETPPGLRLSLVARAAGTSVKTLRELNPDLVGNVLPGRLHGPILASATASNGNEPSGRRLHIPNRGFGRFGVMIGPLAEDAERDQLDTKVSADFDWGKDELLPSVAAHAGFGPSRRSRRDEPALPRKAPDEGPLPPPTALPPATPAPAPQLPPSERRLVRYDVVAGDTVESVARAFGVKPSELRAQNRLSKHSALRPGKTLSLRLAPARRAAPPPSRSTSSLL